MRNGTRFSFVSHPTTPEILETHAIRSHDRPRVMHPTTPEILETHAIRSHDSPLVMHFVQLWPHCGLRLICNNEYSIALWVRLFISIIKRIIAYITWKRDRIFTSDLGKQFKKGKNLPLSKKKLFVVWKKWPILYNRHIFSFSSFFLNVGIVRLGWVFGLIGPISLSLHSTVSF